jgi:bacterioferritin-associated ferredoxin
MDKSYSETAGTVAFPYEYMPVPESGQAVKAVDRSGKVICDARVVKVINPKTFDRTPVVTIEVPIEYVEEARGISRKAEDGVLDDDMPVCRCEEVTLHEIREAIRQGATDVTGVKRRTRAGMGLCQGRTCEKLVQQILRLELGTAPEVIGSGTARPPVRPVTFGALGGGE